MQIRSRKKKEKEERSKEQRGQERSPMWATDKSAAHRRAFTRIYTQSLVAEKKRKKGPEEQPVGAKRKLNYSLSYLIFRGWDDACEIRRDTMLKGSYVFLFLFWLGT